MDRILELCRRIAQKKTFELTATDEPLTIWMRQIHYMSETVYADLVELEDICATHGIKLSVEFIWDRR